MEDLSYPKTSLQVRDLWTRRYVISDNIKSEDNLEDYFNGENEDSGQPRMPNRGVWLEKAVTNLVVISKGVYLNCCSKSLPILFGPHVKPPTSSASHGHMLHGWQPLEMS